jgi:hypothetical protein
MLRLDSSTPAINVTLRIRHKERFFIKVEGLKKEELAEFTHTPADDEGLLELVAAL